MQSAPRRCRGGREPGRRAFREETGVAEHFPYLFWAYNIIWFLIAGYVITLGMRQRSIRRRIERIERALGREEQA